MLPNHIQPSPYLLLVLATLLWSSNFVLGRAVQGDIPPIALSFWRWVVALAILLPFTGPVLWQQRQTLRVHWRALLGLGILGVANFNTFVYLGLTDTTATNAVLMVSTTPVLIVALSFVLLGQTVNSWQGAGILVSMVGVATIVTRGDLGQILALSINRGDLWVLAAVVNWASYSVCLRWRPTGLPPPVFLTALMIAGQAVLLPLYLWDLSRGHGFALNGSNLLTIGYVALGPSVLAFIFWNRGVGQLGANRAGQFLHLMPAFGAVLAMIFLGERLYGFHAAGIMLIAAGIYLTTGPGARRA